jgi:hypothetical protein
MSELKKISCKSCGASLMFDPATQMSSCNFCGTKFEIELAEAADLTISPDGLIPFSVTHDQFKNLVFAWLSEGDYTPDDILTSSVFDEINGLYLPQYFYEGRYSGNWSASSGYDRQESYVVIVNNKAVTRYRTVTDWRPSSGQVANNYSILGFAGQSETLPPTIAPFMHDCSFSAGQLKPFNPEYTSGFNIVPFELDSDIIWNSLGSIQADSIAGADIRQRIPGDRYDHLTFDMNYDHKKVTNILSPAYIVHYDYSDDKFHVYMDGDKSIRIEGERPVDKERQDKVHVLKKPIRRFWWGFGITAVLMMIIYSNMSYSEQSSFEEVFMPIYFIGMIIWGIIAYVKSNNAVKAVLEASKKRRQDILQSMQEGTSIPPLETTQEIVEEQAPVSEEATVEDNNNGDNTPSF